MAGSPLTINPDPALPWSTDWATVGLGDYGLSTYKGQHDYGNVTNPDRITFVDDPVLGSARKVMKMVVYDEDWGATSDPRAQADMPRIIQNGATFWAGTGIYLPANFPILPNAIPPNFITLIEFTGAPIANPYPFRFCIRDDTDVFRIQHHDHQVAVHNVWERPIVRERWLDLAFQIRLSRVPSWGFIRCWINAGDGWRAQTINGRSPTYRMATLGTANWRGPNTFQLKLYRTKDALVGDDDPVTAYFAGHKYGDSLASVDVRSYA